MSQTQKAVPLVLTDEDRAELVRWLEGGLPWLAERARIVLACAEPGSGVARVAAELGKPLKPKDVRFAADLPKTRSGKIMRRLLRDIAEGKALGDTTTLADPAVVAKLKEQYADEQG